MHFWHKFISCQYKFVHYFIHFILLKQMSTWKRNLTNRRSYFPSSVFSLYNFWIFAFCIFFYTSNNKIILFYLSLEFSISSFVSSKFLGTLFIKTNWSCLIFESIKALEIKTSKLYNLSFANANILLCFFS